MLLSSMVASPNHFVEAASSASRLIWADAVCRSSIEINTQLLFLANSDDHECPVQVMSVLEEATMMLTYGSRPLEQQVPSSWQT